MRFRAIQSILNNRSVTKPIDAVNTTLHVVTINYHNAENKRSHELAVNHAGDEAAILNQPVYQHYPKQQLQLDSEHQPEQHQHVSKQQLQFDSEHQPE